MQPINLPLDMFTHFSHVLANFLMLPPISQILVLSDDTSSDSQPISRKSVEEIGQMNSQWNRTFTMVEDPTNSL